MTPAFERHFRRVLASTISDIENMAGLGVILPDPVVRQIVANGGRRVGLLDLSRDTRRSVFNALSEAKADGLAQRAADQRTRDLVPSGRSVNAGSRYRATMIAHTETKFAQNTSAHQSYRNMDVVTGVMAFDAQRGPTDAECEKQNGQIYTFDESKALIASEHSNGTLSIAPHIDEVRMVQAASDADLGTNSLAAGAVAEMLAELRRDPDSWRTNYGGDEHLVRFMTAKQGTQAARAVGPDEFQAIRNPHLERGINNRAHLEANIDGTSAGFRVNGNRQNFAIGDTPMTMAFIRERDGWVYGAKLAKDAVVNRLRNVESVWMEVVSSSESRRLRGIAEDMVQWGNRNAAYRSAVLDIDACVTLTEDIMMVVNRAKFLVDGRSLPGGEFELRGARELDTPGMEEYRAATIRLPDSPGAVEQYRVAVENERARNAYAVMMGAYRRNRLRYSPKPIGRNLRRSL